jgi:hypothetical protein
MSSGPPGYPPIQPYPYARDYYGSDAPGATASLVLGIVAMCAVPFVCCCGIGELVTIPCGIIAVVQGIAATRRISASQGALGGNGKAVAGITIGGTALAIGLVLLVFVLIGAITPPVHMTPVSSPSG